MCDVLPFLDNLYFSGAIDELVTRRVLFGADFNITYHRVSYSSGQLSITALYRLMSGGLWLVCMFLNSPVLLLLLHTVPDTIPVPIFR
jgi:hypothetical protein